MTTPAPAPTPAPVPAPTSDGKTLGIVGLVLAFVFALAGLIVSIIARSQSKKAGVPNTPATVGLVLSIIFLIGQIVTIILLTTVFASLLNACADLPPGVYTLENGGTLTCG